MTENHAQAENAAISSRPASTCCCHRKETPRSEELQADLHRRLNRVIGQLGGVKTMIDDCLLYTSGSSCVSVSCS